MAEAIRAANTRGTVNFNTPEFTRTNELFHLKACANKANLVLGWQPKTTFSELVYEMVNADVNALNGNVVLHEAECSN